MEKPRLLQGFRDYLPADMLRRRSVIRKIEHVYERYGFLPLDTPALEYADLMMGRYGEDEKLIYNFKDHGDRHVAMRYDLTVPLARVATSYPELPKPFKRYQLGTVWRADSPQRGRYREFMQLDADTVGSSNPLADAEMVLMMADLMQEIGLGDHYIIRINHRGVFSALLRAFGVASDKQAGVMRIIDKLEKIGDSAAKSELTKLMDKKQVEQFFELVEETDATQLFKHLHVLFASDKQGLEALENFQEIYHLILDGGRAEYVIDLSIIRGLDYYTGIVYETSLKNDRAAGSICSGGRYDALMKELAGQDLPAVGTSVGIDRLLAVAHISSEAVTRPVVLVMFPGYEKETLHLAQKLRSAGVSITVPLGNNKLGKQLQYADALDAKTVLMYGESEIAKGIVMMRDMKSGEQKEINVDPVDTLLKELL